MYTLMEIIDGSAIDTLWW